MNSYLQIVKNLSINNKYTKWYIELISTRLIRPKSRAETKKLFGYVESHHILPRCLCGDKSEIKDKNNQVFLTFREHIIAHLLLCKMFENTNMKMRMMSACASFNKIGLEQFQERLLLNSKLLELLKLESIKGGKISSSGSNNGMYGKTHSEETRKKMRESSNPVESSGKYIRTPEIIEKFRTNRMGKGMGDANGMKQPEAREKIRQSRLGKKKFINIITKEVKMFKPEDCPENYILSSLYKDSIIA